MKLRRIALSIISLLSLTACGLVDFDEFSFYDMNSSSETNSVQQSEVISEKTSTFSGSNHTSSGNSPEHITSQTGFGGNTLDWQKREAILNKISEEGNFTATATLEAEYTGQILASGLFRFATEGTRLNSTYKIERNYFLAYNGDSHYKKSITESHTINERDIGYADSFAQVGYVKSNTTFSKSEVIYDGIDKRYDDDQYIRYEFNYELQRADQIGHYMFAGGANMDWFYQAREIVYGVLEEGQYDANSLTIEYYPDIDKLNYWGGWVDFPEIAYTTRATLILKDLTTPKKLILESYRSLGMVNENSSTFDYKQFNYYTYTLEFSNFGSTTFETPQRVNDCPHHELRKKEYWNWDETSHVIVCNDCTKKLGIEPHTFDSVTGRCTKCNYTKNQDNNEKGPIIATKGNIVFYLYDAEKNNDGTYFNISALHWVSYSDGWSEESDRFIDSILGNVIYFSDNNYYYYYYPGAKMVVSYSLNETYTPISGYTCDVYHDVTYKFYLDVDSERMGQERYRVDYLNSLTPDREMVIRELTQRHESAGFESGGTIEDNGFIYSCDVCKKCGEILNHWTSQMLGDENVHYISADQLKEALVIPSISVLRKCNNRDEDEFLYVEMEYSLSDEKTYFVVDKNAISSLLIDGNVLYRFQCSYDTDYQAADDPKGYEIQSLLRDQVQASEYFLSGSFNSWKLLDYNFKFTIDPDDPNHYTIEELILSDDIQCKVMSNNGTWYGDGSWGDGNGGNVFVEAGTYNVDFYVDCDYDCHFTFTRVD